MVQGASPPGRFVKLRCYGIIRRCLLHRAPALRRVRKVEGLRAVVVTAIGVGSAVG